MMEIFDLRDTQSILMVCVNNIETHVLIDIGAGI